MYVLKIDGPHHQQIKHQITVVHNHKLVLVRYFSKLSQIKKCLTTLLFCNIFSRTQNNVWALVIQITLHWKNVCVFFCKYNSTPSFLVDLQDQFYNSEKIFCALDNSILMFYNRNVCVWEREKEKEIGKEKEREREK